MKSMRRLCSLVLGLLTAALLGAEPVPAKPAPAWTLPDLAGEMVGSAQFKGKVVIVDFWAGEARQGRADHHWHFARSPRPGNSEEVRREAPHELHGSHG
jgi:hypothetical protein